MPQKSYDIVKQRSEAKSHGHYDHHCKKCLIQFARKQVVHGEPAHKRKGHVYHGHQKSAAHIYKKQFSVSPEVGYKDAKQ